MSKLNKKGFMLAEVVVVSVVVATVLVTLFIGLNKTTSAYERRNRFNDIDALYYAMEVDKYLERENITPRDGNKINSNLDGIYNNFSYTATAQSFYVKNLDDFAETIENGSYNQTLNDYVTYLSGNIVGDYNHLIVAELCKSTDDCYYYTFKVGDNND